MRARGVVHARTGWACRETRRPSPLPPTSGQGPLRSRPMARVPWMAATAATCLSRACIPRPTRGTSMEMSCQSARRSMGEPPHEAHVSPPTPPPPPPRPPRPLPSPPHARASPTVQGSMAGRASEPSHPRSRSHPRPRPRPRRRS
eukprot:scaffold88567_cov61-Phaeocystis_antarctica.AAC.5